MREIMSLEDYKKLPSLKDADALELATEIPEVLYKKRGRNIKVLHVEDKTSIADYFVLCTGTSSTHVRSLADEAEYMMTLRGVHASNVEGRGNGAWVLIDYGHVIVHVFNREARDFYNLDKLYSDIKEIEIEGAEDDADEEF